MQLCIFIRINTRTGQRFYRPVGCRYCEAPRVQW